MFDPKDVFARIIDRWIAERAEVDNAVRGGRFAAEARVARGLYGRAVGHDRTVVRMAIAAREVKPSTSMIHYATTVRGLHRARAT